jgi:aminoglycoside phosphotransferase (APT) family kinase protein
MTPGTGTAATGNPMQRSSRDLHALGLDLERWLSGVVGAAVHVDDVSGTEANGMSSDTVLFRATWPHGEGGRDGTRDDRLVARLAPDRRDVPVFPSYDLGAQFATMRLVHDVTDVPVPEPLWCDPVGDATGAPLLVMRRVDGRVPPDVMPYPFGGNWLFDAAPHETAHLQRATIEAIAGLHAIDEAPRQLPFLERAEPGATPLGRHVAHTRTWYDAVAADGGRSRLVERAFAWPAGEGDAVLSWGDARIGNVIYTDFAPAALLDWEMAGLGPRELDVCWLAYSHLVFQDLAESLGLPGMPHLLRIDDVAETYAGLTGHEPRDLRFFFVYAAIQWAIVFLRTGQRQIHFGERERPAEPDDLILTRNHLETMLADRGLDG